VPLQVAQLTDLILQVTDKTRSDFVGFPVVRTLTAPFYDAAATNNLVAKNWGNAVLQYFATITVPVLTPTIFPIAQAAFEPAMAFILGAEALAMKAFGAGLDAFVAVMVTGLAVPGVATPPPPGTFTFSPAITQGQTPEQVTQTSAANLALAIHNWATNPATGGKFTPPGGASISWT